MFRAYRVVAKERVAVVAVAGVALVIAGDLDGLWVLVIIDVIVAVGLVVEHARVENPSTRRRERDHAT